MSLNNLSVSLGEQGRRGEALAAVEEAVRIRRELAGRWPAVFCPALAGSLRRQAWILSELGRADDAKGLLEEAQGLDEDSSE